MRTFRHDERVARYMAWPKWSLMPLMFIYLCEQEPAMIAMSGPDVVRVTLYSLQKRVPFKTPKCG